MKKNNLKKLLLLCLLTANLMAPKQAHAMGISSQCGILMDQLSGRVLFEKCANDQMYIASITKILTALIAIEEGDLDAWVDVTYEIVSQVGSRIYLEVGDQIQLKDLLYGLMLRSGNDAAFAIAEFIGGDEETFAKRMNERAKEIGMTNSAFQNASGLDETTFNLSTAQDMAVLMQYAMNNPMFREIAGTQNHRATTKEGKTYAWTNKHKLITGFYEPAIAGKTGFTKQARRTLVTSATRDDLELIVVTLKAGDDWNDHMALFEYGFNNYEVQMVVEVGELRLTKDLMKTHEIEDRLYVNRPVYLTVKNDGSEEITTNLMLNEEATEDEQVGTLQVLLDGKVQEEIPVYRMMVEPEVREQSWFDRFLNWFTGMVNA